MCRVEICATTGHQHQEATRFLYRFEHVYIYSIYAIYRTIIPMSSPTAASLLDQKIVGQFVEKYFLVSFSVIRCHLLRTVSSEDPFSQSNPSALIVPSSDRSINYILIDLFNIIHIYPDNNNNNNSSYKMNEAKSLFTTFLILAFLLFLLYAFYEAAF